MIPSYRDLWGQIETAILEDLTPRMSFEVFLCCWEDGEPAGIPEARLKEEFGDALVSEDPEFSCWHLQYAGEIKSCDVYFSRHEAHSDQIKSLMVSRPIAEDRLWDSLFRIMQLGNFVLFFPGGKTVLIADPEALRHFPAGLVDDLGGAIVIRRGADIVAAIETA